MMRRMGTKAAVNKDKVSKNVEENGTLCLYVQKKKMQMCMTCGFFLLQLNRVVATTVMMTITAEVRAPIVKKTKKRREKGRGEKGEKLDSTEDVPVVWI
jgi:hypothetical protein